jgi:DNA-binding response OmpR family regulator
MPDERYVLIVEDDPFYSKLYKAAADKEGLKIVVAGSGDQALQFARENKPGLIVLDLIMAGKDGFQVLKELKADPVLKDIPAIILSNVSEEEDQKKARALGAADYLIKSNLSFEEMMEKIKSYLG